MDVRDGSYAVIIVPYLALLNGALVMSGDAGATGVEEL